MLNVAKDLYRQLPWFGLKRDGIITIGWEKIAKIEIQSKEKCPVLRFNAEMVEKHGINRATVRSRFEEAWRPSAGEVSWSL